LQGEHPIRSKSTLNGVLFRLALLVALLAASAACSTGSNGNAVGPSASSSSPARSAPPVETGFPNDTNTGYRNAPGYPGSLHTCATPIKSNTTYSFCKFVNGVNVGSPSQHVVNVTFYSCDFQDSTPLAAMLVGIWGDNITFDYSSFQPDVSAPPVPYSRSYQYGIEADGGWNTSVGKLTVSHSDFWGFGDAIDINGSTRAKPQVFRDNWIHDAAEDGGVYHTDGIGTLGPGGGDGSYVVIDHNTIESAGNTQGIAFQSGHYDHLKITGNLFGGWGYSICVVGGSYINFSRNTFSTLVEPTYGPLYTSVGFTGFPAPWQWRDNKWLVPTGAQWGLRGHNGWFWMPVAGGRNGKANDSQFVSRIDYTG
jgi:parallel beta helix pectate lyase-like protein